VIGSIVATWVLGSTHATRSDIADLLGFAITSARLKIGFMSLPNPPGWEQRVRRDQARVPPRMCADGRKTFMIVAAAGMAAVRPHFDNVNCDWGDDEMTSQEKRL
jgi:hypothetical protein